MFWCGLGALIQRWVEQGVWPRDGPAAHWRGVGLEPPTPATALRCPALPPDPHPAAQLSLLHPLLCRLTHCLPP